MYDLIKLDIILNCSFFSLIVLFSAYILNTHIYTPVCISSFRIALLLNQSRQCLLFYVLFEFNNKRGYQKIKLNS